MKTGTTSSKGMHFMKKSRMSRNKQNSVSHKRMRGSTSKMTSKAASVSRGVLKGPRNFLG